MGKAEILSEIGKGRYTIRVVVDHSDTEMIIEIYQRALENVEKMIADEEAKEKPSEHLIKHFESRRLNLTIEIYRYQSMIDETIILNAWCADMTENLTGIVGTIEPATELKNGINIQPGENDNHIYNERRDGILKPFVCLDLYQSMLNYMLIPGIQKHRPTYRYGTISNIEKDNDTCDINIDETKSIIQNIDVNFKSNYQSVPIEYMDCNSQVFENGDRVIIKFDHFDRYNPIVIGFVDNPKPCSVYIKLNTINGYPLSSYTGYYVMITQPKQELITSASKGEYIEEYTVLCVTPLDRKGVALIEVEKEIDPDLPMNVWVKNDSKFQYYTEDWRGEFPDIGAKKNISKFDWYYPGDLDRDDYVYDELFGHKDQFIDLREVETTQFERWNGEIVSGRELNFTGVKGLKVQWWKEGFTNIECLSGDENHPIDDFTNRDGSEEFNILNIAGIDWPLWIGCHFYEPYGFSLMCRTQFKYDTCWSDNTVFQCKYYGYTDGRTWTKNNEVFAPCIFYSRDGDNYLTTHLSGENYALKEETWDGGNIGWTWICQDLDDEHLGWNCCETGVCEQGYFLVLEEELKVVAYELGEEDI